MAVTKHFANSAFIFWNWFGTETFVSAEDENLTAIADENYTWTYTSPEFPMLQAS
jgi:hypothetical protein